MPESPDGTPQEPQPPVDLQTDRPHGARVYDVLLGGTTNYPADREQAEKVLESIPAATQAAKANRGFIHRAARHLVSEAGIRQFLDIGSGIPTSPNLHEVAQSIDPRARIVYADKDPIVLAHSHALHVGTPEGRTAYIQADATDPRSILDSAHVRGTLDLAEPVALTCCLLLHWLPVEVDPYEVVRTLLAPLPAGSALVVSHVTQDFDPGVGQIEDDFKRKGSTVRTRTKAEVARFFDGLEMVEPGLTVPHRWRPAPADVDAYATLTDQDVPVWAGVALKTG